MLKAIAKEKERELIILFAEVNDESLSGEWEMQERSDHQFTGNKIMTRNLRHSSLPLRIFSQG